MPDAMKPQTKSKRSLANLWLNPRYQGRYVFWITLSGLMLVLFQTTIFYLFTRENYAILVDLGPMTDEAKRQLYLELWQIVALLMAGGIVFLAVVTLIGLVFSHRTAGPLYHFNRVFTEIKNGNSGARVALRPTDDFQDVAQSFNEMMDRLQGKT